MTLGSVYAGGAYFFARVMFGAPWRAVAAGFPAVIMFVWMAAIATLFHLDRFNKDSLPFVAWAALYVVTPFLVPWLVGRNHRRFGAPSRPAAAAPARPCAASSAARCWRSACCSSPRRTSRSTAGRGCSRRSPRASPAPSSAMYGTVWLAVGVHRTWAGARIPLQAHVDRPRVPAAGWCAGRTDRLGQRARGRDRGGRRGDARDQRGALSPSHVGCRACTISSPPSCAFSAACSRSSARPPTPIR